LHKKYTSFLKTLSLEFGEMIERGFFILIFKCKKIIMIIEKEIKYEVDKLYSEAQLLEIGMEQLNNQGLDYIVYEKDSLVFFFEHIKADLLRLFCITSRKSFYLS